MEIYVWGTGCGAGDLMEKGLAPDRITAFVDSAPVQDTFCGRKVLRPENLHLNGEDLLIVTARAASQISARCDALGIPQDRILYLKNYIQLTDRNAGCPDAGKILGEDLMKKLFPEQTAVTVPSSLQGTDLSDGTDFVRSAVLALVTGRLGDVPGAMAELGVFRGNFARQINRMMPHRTLYLFDTFRGFDTGEAAQEASLGTCGAGFLQAHENTDGRSVLHSMPFPDHCRLMPGLFPESARGLEEQFCLVSLDVDFYESTLKGLRYFWPRISPGGFLMLHDWGSGSLTGVKRAFLEFEREWGNMIPAVPIPDVGNSLIACKS